MIFNITCASLYHCFSETMIYSDQAYPNILYYSLFTFGSVPLILSLLYPAIFGSWSTQCAMDMSRWTYSDQCIRCQPSFVRIRAITAIIVVTWDLMTLLLYIWKVCLFRKSSFEDKNNASYQRITSILYRIIIATLLYEFIFYLAIVFGNENLTGFVSWFFCILLTVVINYCMVLMQEHNTKEYREFLKIIHKLKIGYLCCCCQPIIMYELKEIGYDYSASECHHCCICIKVDEKDSSNDNEDEEGGHLTANVATMNINIPKLNSCDSLLQTDDWPSSTEEMKSNKSSTRDIKQSLATINESDKLDNKIKAYPQLKSNINNEEESEIVRSCGVRQRQLNYSEHV